MDIQATKGKTIGANIALGIFLTLFGWCILLFIMGVGGALLGAL